MWSITAALMKKFLIQNLKYDCALGHFMSTFTTGQILILMISYWISQTEEAWRRLAQDPCALSHCVSRCCRVVTDDSELDYSVALFFGLIGIIMSHDE